MTLEYILPMQLQNSDSFARGLDVEDPLKEFRKEFLLPVAGGKDQIYFLGNSLGLQPIGAKGEIEKILEKWGAYGVEGFFHGDDPWMDYHEGLQASLAEIVGAKSSEITVMNQLTVNLHLMLVSFYRPNGKRKKILCEARAFPSDQYTLETHLKFLGLDPATVIIEVNPRPGEFLLHPDDLLAAIRENKDELALVFFSGINYYTGQAFDMRAIAEMAHDCGALAGFDLAHAAGNIALALHEWDVDFACWCSYKYLNSGPGGVGGAFIHERHHNDNTIPRFAGWWGYDKQTRFRMEEGFVPIRSAEGWQLSTPSLLLYACHRAALDVFTRAGWDRVQKKRSLLNEYLWFVVNEARAIARSREVKLITPKNKEERGAQLSMLVADRGKQVFDALASHGVMADWREPDVIRVAPVPLYNSFEEVWRFGNILSSILQSS
jgi:kynureninase